jgi:hypothetical protein
MTITALHGWVPANFAAPSHSGFLSSLQPIFAPLGDWAIAYLGSAAWDFLSSHLVNANNASVQSSSITSSENLFRLPDRPHPLLYTFPASYQLFVIPSSCNVPFTPVNISLMFASLFSWGTPRGQIFI